MTLYSHDELQSPYPLYGGKRPVAHLVWEAFGDPPNYLEPFFGTGAVLLSRPTPGKFETVNDIWPYIPNFWRSVQKDPEAVARHADHPLFEVDLHARHAWLIEKLEPLREAVMSDPDYCDPQIAGYWVWGIALWIGSGWCVPTGNVSHKLPDLYTRGHGRGIRRSGKIQLPAMQGRRGVQRLPNIQGSRRGVHSTRVESLRDWFLALQERLRDVRVICGDWKRIMGPSVTGTTRVRNQGMTPCGVFLDPNYPNDGRTQNLYAHDDGGTWFEVRDWAVEHGDDPDLRIALCGYAGDGVEMPSMWREVAWKANGMGNKLNADRERIWFSPHCVKTSQPSLFEMFDVELEKLREGVQKGES